VYLSVHDPNSFGRAGHNPQPVSTSRGSNFRETPLPSIVTRRQTSRWRDWDVIVRPTCEWVADVLSPRAHGESVAYLVALLCRGRASKVSKQQVRSVGEQCPEHRGGLEGISPPLSGLSYSTKPIIMIYWYINNYYKISSIVIDKYGTYFIHFFYK
jgi:hypothetical protein